MPVADGEWHRVLYVDGIWLARDLVVLICRSDERVVSWYMARSETSRAWSALMDPIPAPDVVVADGGTGFASAVRRSWPGTRVQRCVFHAFCQVKRYTVSVNLFFTSFAKQARRSRKGGFTGCANVFSPIPVTAWRGRPSAGPSACRTCRLS